MTIGLVIGYALIALIVAVGAARNTLHTGFVYVSPAEAGGFGLLIGAFWPITGFCWLIGKAADLR